MFRQQNNLIIINFYHFQILLICKGKFNKMTPETVKLKWIFLLIDYKNLPTANFDQYIYKLYPSTLNSVINTFKDKLFNWLVRNSFYSINEFLTCNIGEISQF